VVPLIGGIWWVGYLLPEALSPSHCYLIERGDQSVLVDPACPKGIDHLLKKIEQVTSVDNIRYLLVHNALPGNVLALSALLERIKRPDAVLVTHSHTEVTLRSLGMEIPAWCPDRHDWSLDLGGRTLRFTQTPYAPDPGAICTLDTATATLFCSGLFGAINPEPQLIASDISSFESLIPFHELRLSNRDILRYALHKLGVFTIRTIAPHMGPVIPEHLIAPLFERLGVLECGLQLEASDDPRAVVHVNRLLRDITDDLLVFDEFGTMADRLLDRLHPFLPAVDVEFCIKSRGGRAMRLSRSSGYQAELVKLEEPCAGMVKAGTRPRWHKRYGPRNFHVRYYAEPQDAAPRPVRRAGDKKHYLWLPLFSPVDQNVLGVVRLELDRPVSVGEELNNALGSMSAPLAMAAEREVVSQRLRREHDRYYKLAIRDPLSGLYTRRYFLALATHMLRRHERDPRARFGLARFNIDSFRLINETHSPPVGDRVLQGVAEVMRASTRACDVAVRYGGDEFVVFLHADSLDECMAYTERVLAGVKRLEIRGGERRVAVTLSAGVALLARKETLESLLKRSERALRRSKARGGNQSHALERSMP